jgi:hypothetical protein
MQDLKLFAALLEIINAVCINQTVNMEEYRDIVHAIRTYSDERDLTEDEKTLMYSRYPNYSSKYNPLLDPSKIRYSLAFDSRSTNRELQSALTNFWAQTTSSCRS